MRIEYNSAIEQLDMLNRLAEFKPVVIGTPPLGIDTPSSDIDLACTSEELERFERVATAEFGTLEDFQCHRMRWQELDSIIIEFQAFQWPFEVFCQPIPTDKQWGVRHFQVEKRVLKLAPHLKPLIVALKNSGMQTEPAFAKVLRLTGDPYLAVLELEKLGDESLRKIVDQHVG